MLKSFPATPSSLRPAARGALTALLLTALLPGLHARPFQPPGADRTPASLSTPDALWSQIQAMESGPTGEPVTTPSQAAARTRAHLKKHIRLLEDFIAACPRDPRHFQARLRRGTLMASLATLDGDTALLERAEALLADLERSPGLSREKQTDAAFHRLSVLFLRARGHETQFAERLAHAAVHFHTRFPADRRGPRLMVEAASLPELPSTTRRQLLETALTRSPEEPLRRRAADYLRQLDALGKKIQLEMPLLHGGHFSLSSHRGKVLALAFWSADSPPSLLWLAPLAESSKLLPHGAELILVSVDSDPAPVRQAAQDLGLSQPILFSRQGWEHPALRTLGINAVPALWLIDHEGRVRLQNPRLNLPETARALLRQK